MLACVCSSARTTANEDEVTSAFISRLEQRICTISTPKSTSIVIVNNLVGDDRGGKPRFKCAVAEGRARVYYRIHLMLLAHHASAERAVCIRFTAPNAATTDRMPKLCHRRRRLRCAREERTSHLSTWPAGSLSQPRGHSRSARIEKHALFCRHSEYIAFVEY